MLKLTLAIATLIVAPVPFAPAFAQDHQHDGQSAPAPQAPLAAMPDACHCPMMQGMMSSQHDSAKPVAQGEQAGASDKPTESGAMADMPCMHGKAAPPAAAPVPQQQPPHDHDHSADR